LAARLAGRLTEPAQEATTGHRPPTGRRLRWQPSGSRELARAVGPRSHVTGSGRNLSGFTNAAPRQLGR
jgi:hypothetical protein